WIFGRYWDSALGHQFSQQLHRMTLSNGGLDTDTNDALSVVDRKPSVSRQNRSGIDPSKSRISIALVADIESRTAVHEKLYGGVSTLVSRSMQSSTSVSILGIDIGAQRENQSHGFEVFLFRPFELNAVHPTDAGGHHERCCAVRVRDVGV